MEAAGFLALLALVVGISLLHPFYQMRKLRIHKDSLARAYGLRNVKVPWRKKYAWYAHHYGGGIKGALLAPLAASGYPVARLASLPDPGSLTGSVWVGGTPREWCSIDLQVKTVTNVFAGKAVIRDTDDDHFQVAGADAENVMGFCSEINWTNKAWVPNTAPTAEDIMQVVLPGMGALISAHNSANLSAGALVASAAAGTLKALDTTKVQSCLGRVLQDSDGSGTPERAVIGGAF